MTGKSEEPFEEAKFNRHVARVRLTRGGVMLSAAAASVLLFMLAAARWDGSILVEAQIPGPCDPPNSNPIVCENDLPGAPASEWDVSGAGDPSIQGFATRISVNRGQTVEFKVSTAATAYHIDIYRLGYYGGLGARKVATVLPSATLPQAQPACLTQPSTGLIDCGNWSESASWMVPEAAVSGIYLGRLQRDDASGASHIVFIVRDDARPGDVLFQTSDTTWQAYNRYGGNSLYTGAPAGRAYKVSYNRPFTNRAMTGGPQESWLFNAEYPMVRWLEANGYNVTYSTGVDTDARGPLLLVQKVFMSVGHDEYWSATQRANVEAARDAGVHLAFFSGNEIFWKTRWEISIDGSGTARRTLVCYKETHANAKIDPVAGVWTGTWRDSRFSPPADGGRPENALSGTMFSVNGVRNDVLTVPQAEGRLRLWRNTTVAKLNTGKVASFAAGILGYEWDEDYDNDSRPAGLIRLSSSTHDVTPKYLQDNGNFFGPGTADAHPVVVPARQWRLRLRSGDGAMVVGTRCHTRPSWCCSRHADQAGDDQPPGRHGGSAAHAASGPRPRHGQYRRHGTRFGSDFTLARRVRRCRNPNYDLRHCDRSVRPGREESKSHPMTV